ncbi:AAEL005275-PA [Aedes aegypti]|uniref:AAEL005275-PA n=1 Tax=Aedes aegypti TaxID=7159 RepID=Q17AL5_AEDAE|nr:AAEL005275-PA [Aedes aegypti]
MLIASRDFPKRVKRETRTACFRRLPCNYGNNRSKKGAISFPSIDCSTHNTVGK